MSRHRYILLGNGSVARRFLEGVADEGRPDAVILNAERQRDADGIRAVCGSRGIPVEVWDNRIRDVVTARLANETELWLLSIYFGHILDQEVLTAAGGRAVNLHASLLPWNRGVHTNVWPIVNRTPAGVSLHVMERGVDRGALLVQREVPVSVTDTGASLYAKLEECGLSLLRTSWPDEVLAVWPGTPQPPGGSEHRLKDFAKVEAFDLDAHPEARRFFDVLRARSFPPYPGLRIRMDGQDIEATVTLKVPDA